VALVLVAQVGFALSADDRTIPVSVGPLDGRRGVGSAIALAAAAVVLKLVLDLVAAVASARLAADVLALRRRTILRAFVLAPWLVQAREREGILQEYASTHAHRAAAASISATSGLAAGCSLAALLLSALVVNTWGALTIIAFGGVLFVLLLPLTRVAARFGRVQREANARFVTRVAEASAVSREVRTFGVERALFDRLGSSIDEFSHAYVRTQTATRAAPDVFQSVALLLLVGSLLALYLFEVDGLASFGAVLLLLMRALLHTRTIQGTMTAIGEQAAYVTQLREREAAFAAAVVPRGEEVLEEVADISFRDVSFSYDGSTPALAAISFDVRAGETIGIVGPSGAGKSTLVSILLGLVEPTSGEFHVNGRPPRAYTATSWFANIAFVPQEPRLLDASVADNIRFLRSDIVDADVERGAVLANIHEEIVRWPAGYATPAGPRGVALSGGQRQRICLARALAGDPATVLLDEATSSLDVRSEAAIQEAIASLKGQRTMFIVAHRISTLAICDRLVVLRDGVMEDIGTVDELRRRNDYFARALQLSRLA
jgi:ABC-type multidrug transport system fused ATPase/permease subunit